MAGYLSLALEALFPAHCIACKQDGVWFCGRCLEKTELITGNPCTECGSFQREHLDHQDDCVLDGLVALGFYHDPRLRALIHGLKYQSATCLAPSIRALIHRMKEARRDPWPWAGEREISLQSVAGGEKRLHARGFDQADVIRDLVHGELIPWAKRVSVLERRASVRPQAELDPGDLRHANVHGVFSVASSSPLPDAVILIDDVFTTGSTMKEAARVLREAGVMHVYGVVLALGK